MAAAPVTAPAVRQSRETGQAAQTIASRRDSQPQKGSAARPDGPGRALFLGAASYEVCFAPRQQAGRDGIGFAASAESCPAGQSGADNTRCSQVSLAKGSR